MHIHAAGLRTVLIRVVHTKMSTSSTDPKWTGKILNLDKLAKTMDRSPKDCIWERKKNNFPVFSEVLDPEVRTGKPIYRGLAEHYIKQMYIDEEAGCFEDEEDLCDEET